MGIRLKLEGVEAASDYLTKTMSEQRGGRFGGSVNLLKPDGTPYPGSPFTGAGLPGPWAAAVDGNDNIWISNFAGASGEIAQLCGVRTETCPPGMKTMARPGFRRQAATSAADCRWQTDIDIDPAGRRLGDEQLAGTSTAVTPILPRRSRRVAGGQKAWWCSTAWRSPCGRRKIGPAHGL